uniref:Galectin domain-containing protein n=1 Tax=Trichobilharzia regenti TaxID=157069 RepID=A0AA85JS17_TRIRE|nr:unnamed protein product [Trichobilharzia regenti]
MNSYFDEQETEFTYEIPDCLMDGDYIELHGVCHGERIVFELLTKEGTTRNKQDELPLQIVLETKGPVLVISRNKVEVAKQEKFVGNRIRENMPFELCVHANEDYYTVILNKEKVCDQKHLVPLSEAFALSMKGKVDILSLEFKDIYYDEDEMNNTINTTHNSSIRHDDVHSGFVRVNELRQSSIRRNDSPILVPTRTSSKLDKYSIKSKDSNLEVTAWKTSNDLSKADLDTDYKATTLERNSAIHSYRNSNEFSQNSESRISATLPPIGKTSNEKINDYGMGSRGNLNSNDTAHIKSRTGITGSRKSATLSTSKIEQRYNGEGRSQTDAGDLLRGSYSVLDDEEPVMPRITATTSTPNLQEKNKKKRFSLLGKSRKSTGSETDVRKDSKNRKGSAPEIKSKNGEGEKKKKGFHLKNPFKRSKPKELTPTASSSTSLNRSDPRMGSRSPIPAINVSINDRLPKELSKKPAPEIASYLIKTNPSTEFDTTNLTGRRSLSEDVYFRPFTSTSSHYDEYENLGSHTERLNSDHIKRKSLSSSRLSNDSPSRGDLQSHLKSKSPAPELAAVIHSNDMSPNLGETTITEGMDTHFVSMSTVDRLEKKSKNDKTPTSEKNLKLKGPAPELAAMIHAKGMSPNLRETTITESSDSQFESMTTLEDGERKPGQSSARESLANIKLKGTAPEIASIIHSKNLSPNMGDITLTQSSDLPHTSVPTMNDIGSKPFKPNGSASEIAAQIHNNNYSDRLPYPEYTISGTSETEKRSSLYYEESGQIVHEKKIKTTRKAISLSEYVSDADGTESGGSDVFTDNECYLEVGKSQYYFDRKRSLKNYRSKRSTRMEREARRKMGLNRNDSEESQSSSISSLKPTDRKLTPKYRKRQGAGKEEVSSWLNNYESNKQTYGAVNVDGNIRPMYKSPVMAAGCVEQQSLLHKYMLKDIDQSINCDFNIELPHSLTLGRSALLYGHFKYDSPVVQSCLLRLNFTTTQESEAFESLYLRIWSNGGLDVLRSNHSLNSENLITSSNFIQHTTTDGSEMDISNKQLTTFQLQFICQSLYLAITSSELFTLLVKNTLTNLSNYCLKSFELEDSTTAELDRFVMSKHVSLPLTIHPTVELNQSHNVCLLTKLTADTKRIMIEYIYEVFSKSERDCIQIVLDFDESCLLVQDMTNEMKEFKKQVTSEIPYIPEQIRKIRIHLLDNQLKVFLNTTEMCVYSFEQSYYLENKLSLIHVNGDFMLLDARINRDFNEVF